MRRSRGSGGWVREGVEGLSPTVVFALGVVASAGLVQVESMWGWVSALGLAAVSVGLAWVDVCGAGVSRRLMALGLAGAAVVCADALERGRAPDVPAELGLREPGEVSVVATGVVEAVESRSPYGWRVRWEMETVDEQVLAGSLGTALYIPVDDVVREALVPGAVVEIFVDVEAFGRRELPGGFDERGWLEGRGYVARAVAREAPKLLERRWHWRAWLSARRLALEDRVLESVGEGRAGPILALITAERGFLAPEYRDPFVQTGTAHLLAVSGLHMGVLGGILWWLLGAVVTTAWPAGCERHGRSRIVGLGVLVGLAGYVVMIGAPVSAVRACVAAGLGVGALLLSRRFCGVHALAVAAVVSVLTRPSVVDELGFALSFAATAGIVCFLAHAPADVGWLEAGRGRAGRWGRRFKVAAGVSLSAGLATWPVLLGYFGVVSVSGLWMNLIVGPLFGAVVFPVVVLSAVVAWCWPSVGGWALGACYTLLEALREALVWSARWPFTEWVVGVPDGLALVVCAGCVGVIVTARLRPRRMIVASGLMVGVLVWGGPGRPPDGVRVHFIPVGQGDATLVQFPDGGDFLVDAGGRRMGPDPGRRVVVPYLHRLGIGALEGLVITHGDLDHVGGAAAVVSRVSTEMLVVDARDGSKPLQELREDARRRGVRVEEVLGVAKLRADLAIAAPAPPAAAGDNDHSLVAMVGRAPWRALLAADIEEAGEHWLVSRYDLRAALLKMPHHGSRTSSSERFIEAVSPRVAVSSSGRGHYFGHPHDEVVARYRRRGVRVYGTHEHGLVVVDLGVEGGIQVRAWIRD